MTALLGICFALLIPAAPDLIVVSPLGFQREVNNDSLATNTSLCGRLWAFSSAGNDINDITTEGIKRRWQTIESGRRILVLMGVAFSWYDQVVSRKGKAKELDWPSVLKEMTPASQSVVRE
jgi:hypothetical protein